MPGGLRFSILVVDDEPAVREIFARCIARRGHHVVTSSTAADGWDRTQHESFDVVLCDLVLPDSTGLWLIERLHSAGCPARVILLTGRPSPEAARRADELGVYAFIAKPIRASALIRVVEQAALG